MVVDEVLRQGVQGISELITIPGLINVDFNDVKAVMSGAGSALMGIGQASGENKAIEAAKLAINSPLLEMSIEGARGILFTIVGGSGLTMHEVNEAAKIITSSADEDAKIIFGAVIDPKFKDDIKITVVATGFNGAKRPVGTSTIAPDRNYSPAPFIEESEDHRQPISKSKASALKIAQAEPAVKKPSIEEEEDDELSIPTFIRKKMM